MMSDVKFLLSALALAACGCVSAQPRPDDSLLSLIPDSAEAMFTVKVVDEQYLPVPNARVIGSFGTEPARGLETYGSERVEQRTDGHGVTIFRHRTFGSWGGVVIEDGYYHFGTKRRIAEGVDKGFLRDRWLPWNPTYTIVVRKILNPVPMYVGRVPKVFGTFTVPVLAHAVGYDLIARDWVIPHGKGTHRDFIFEVQKSGDKYEDPFDVRLKLTFGNPGDGIQVADIPSRTESVSEFRWPREAPESGYQPVLERFMMRKAKNEMWQSNVGSASAFFFDKATPFL